MKSKVQVLMKLMVVLFFGVSSTAFSQDTVWFSMPGKVVASRDSAERFNVVYKNKADTQQVTVYRFLKDGTLQEELNFFPYEPTRLLHGVFKRYSDGRIVQGKWSVEKA